MSGVKQLIVSGSGNNCLYVAGAAHLLGLLWQKKIQPRQKEILYNATNHYLGIKIPKGYFWSQLQDPKKFADWSLILGVALRSYFQSTSQEGEGEFVEKLPELCHRLHIDDFVCVEMQPGIAGVDHGFICNYFQSAGELQTEYQLTEAELPDNLLDRHIVQGRALSEWVQKPAVLSVYMKGVHSDASAHAHYGVLVDEQVFSLERGFVVHSESPGEMSAEHLPSITREASQDRQNDPSFDWQTPQAKKDLIKALNIQPNWVKWFQPITQFLSAIWSAIMWLANQVISLITWPFRFVLSKTRSKPQKKPTSIVLPEISSNIKYSAEPTAGVLNPQQTRQDSYPTLAA